jgi:autotransporter-associated beta strand protein
MARFTGSKRDRKSSVRSSHQGRNRSGIARGKRVISEALEQRVLLTATITGLTGNGLKEAIYANDSFTGTPGATSIAPINASWSADPVTGITNHMFSVDWTGQIEPQNSLQYTFTTLATGGVRLWVNQQLIISDVTDHATPVTLTGQIALQAGKHYAIELEYTNDNALNNFSTMNPQVSLSWQAGTTLAAQVIPINVLFDPTATGYDSDLSNHGTIQLQTWTGLTMPTITVLKNSTSGYEGTQSLATEDADLETAKPALNEYPISFAPASPTIAWNTNYGERYRGYVVPEFGGSYTFTIKDSYSGDQVSFQLWKGTGNTDPDPINGTNLINVTTTGTTGSVTLTADTPYYIEALHTGPASSTHSTNNFSVSWTDLAAGINNQVIGADYLVPYGLHVTAPTTTTTVPVLNTLTTTHDRLMVTSNEWNLLQQEISGAPSGQIATWATDIENQAHTYDTETLTDPDNGNATIVSSGTPIFTNFDAFIADSAVPRVYDLATAYNLLISSNPTQANIYGNEAVKWMTQLANLTKWNDAAYDDFLDTANTINAEAVGYDWLFSFIGSSSNTTGETQAQISTAIDAKGLQAGLGIVSGQPAGTGYNNPANLPGWASTIGYRSSGNNQTEVINGAMVLGALAIGKDNGGAYTTDVTNILNDIFPAVESSLQHFAADDGAWYEGEGYWQYTIEYAIPMMASLQTALGADFGLSSLPGISEIGNDASYMSASGNDNGIFISGDMGNDPRYSEVPSNPSDVNAADANEGLMWLSRRFDQPQDATYERENQTNPGPLDLIDYDSRGNDAGENDLPLAELMRGDTAETNSISNPPADTQYDSEYYTARTSWTNPNASWVGVQGGDQDVNGLNAGHTQMDAGSFEYEANGVRWSQDLGFDEPSGYPPGYFLTPTSTNLNRYAYYRTRAEAHNTLVVNPSATSGGQDLLPNGSAPDGLATYVQMTRTVSTPDQSMTILNMSPAYASSAELGSTGSAQRGILLNNHNGGLLVQDELTNGSTSTANVNWGMMLDIPFASYSTYISGLGTSALTITDPVSGTKQLYLQILGSSGGVFSVTSANNYLSTAPTLPTGGSNQDDSSYTRLGISFNLTASHSTTLAVWMVPVVSGTHAAAPAITPLATWGVIASSPALQLGDFDNFHNGDSTDGPGSANLDPTWVSTLSAQGTPQPFDTIGTSWQNVPFTFKLPAGVTLTNATLTVGLAATATGYDYSYVSGNPSSLPAQVAIGDQFDSAIGTSGTSYTLELTPTQITDVNTYHELNVAIVGADKVDWATLDGIPGTLTVYASAGVNTIKIDPSNNQLVDISIGGSSTSTYQVPVGSFSNVLINTDSGTDTLTIDLSNGNPIAGANLSWNGTGTADNVLVQDFNTTAHTDTFAATPTTSTSGSMTITAGSGSSGTLTYTGAMLGFDLLSNITGILSVPTTETLKVYSLTANTAFTLQGGGTLDLNGSSFWSSGTFTLTGGSAVADGTINGNGAYNLINGTIKSTATLTGSGAVTLPSAATAVYFQGTNTYTGATNINGGQLILSSNSALGTTTLGSVNVASGAQLQLAGGIPAISLNNPLTIAGTGSGSGAIWIGQPTSGTQTLGGVIKLSAAAATITNQNGSAVISNSVSSNFSGAAVLTLINSAATGTLTMGGVISNNGANTVGLTMSTGNLGVVVLNGTNTYTGPTTLSSGTLQLGNPAALGATTAPLYIDKGGTLDLGGKTISNPVTITGNGTGAGATITNSNAATTSVLNGTLTLTGALATSGKNITVNGTISGAGTLTAMGAGSVLNLSGTSNTYTGSTTVSSGTLQLGSAGALGSTSSLTIGVGGLDLGGNAVTTPVTVTASGATITNSNAASPGALNGTLTLNGALTTSGNNTTVSGPISGSGALNMALGAGSVLTLNGSSNTYSGSTTITSGTLQLGGTSALSSSAVTISGGTLDLDGQTISNSITIGATGATITNTNTSASGVLTGTVTLVGALTAAAPAASDTWAMKSTGTFVGGSQTLTKTGLGEVDINATGASGLGNILISAGSLSFGINATMGTGFTVTVNSGATLESFDDSNTFADALNLNGGTVQNNGGSTTFTGSVALGTNTSNTFNVGFGDTTTFSGVISGGGTGTLSGSGAGTLVLAGAGTNTFVGSTTFTGGTLQLANTSSAPLGATTNLLTINGAEILDLDGQTIPNPITIGATGATITNTNTSASGVLTGTVTLSGALTADAAAATDKWAMKSTGTFVGGSQTLTKTGLGEVDINATGASGLGNILISAGSLSFGINATMGTGFSVTVNSGATLESFDDSNTFADNLIINGGTVQNNGGTATFSGLVTLGTGTNTINGTSGTNTIFSGVISGSGSTLTVTTNSDLTQPVTLSALNTYNGLTTVTAGTLVVNGSLAGGVTVNSGASLGGTGTIAGAVTVQSGGTLAPGSSTTIGTLTVNNALTLSGTNGFKINASSGLAHDLVTGSGGSASLAYGGALSITNLGGTFATGQTWDLFNFTTRVGSSVFSNDSLFEDSHGGGATGLPTLASNLFWHFNYATGVLSIASS